MEKAQILNAIKQVRDNSNKRNFKQSFDLIIAIRGVDLKKQNNRIDTFAQLHFERGRKAKICGFVGPELLEQAKTILDTTIVVEDFDNYKAKAKMRKLANEHAFFIAQANIMPKVAAVFGRVLGPKGKMPNPKAGCVVPPNANLEVVSKKLQKTLRIKIETNPMYQALIGTEDMKDEELADNFLTIYNTIIHALPNESNNIKGIYLKLTMGKPVKLNIGKEVLEEEDSKDSKKKPAEKKEKEAEVSEAKEKKKAEVPEAKEKKAKPKKKAASKSEE